MPGLRTTQRTGGFVVRRLPPKGRAPPTRKRSPAAVQTRRKHSGCSHQGRQHQLIHLVYVTATSLGTGHDTSPTQVYMLATRTRLVSTRYVSCKRACLLAAGAADAEARALRAVAVGPSDLPGPSGAAADSQDAAQLRRSCSGTGTRIRVPQFLPLRRPAACILILILQSRPPALKSRRRLEGLSLGASTEVR